MSDKKVQLQNSSADLEGFMASSRDRLSAESWQSAIEYADQKIDQLKVLVKIFAEYRDTGHPFPGDRVSARPVL